MKKMLFLLCITQASIGMTVTFPSAQILKERLRLADLKHFDDDTELSSQLGDQCLNTNGIAMTVMLAMDDYAINMNNKGMTALMKRRKPDIFKAVLKDSPQALEELKKNGLLE